MSLNTSTTYNRHTWAGGEVISSLLLNTMEAGISNATNNLNTTNGYLNGLTYTNGNGGTLKTPTNIQQTEGAISVTYSDIQTASTSQKGVVQLCETVGNTSSETAATPSMVTNAIGALKTTTDSRTDAQKNAAYAKTISQTDGSINVTYADFNPAISITAGTTSAAPSLNISVGGNSMANNVAITTATSGDNAVYGVTKLQNTISSSDDATAATPKCVYDAIHTLIGGGTLDANLTPYTMADGTNDNHLATTQFVMNAFKAQDAMIFKGVLAGWDASQNNGLGNLTPAADRGHTYKVSDAGYINGYKVEVGDMLICTAETTVQATTSNIQGVSANWSIIQTNLDGAVIGPASSTDDHIVTFNGTSGALVKDSGFTIGTSVPPNAVFTDTTYSAGTGISISNGTINNTGIISVTAGDSAGTIKVNNMDLEIPGLTSANNENVGLVKLYDDTGENEDGAITQYGITELFASLVENFGLTLSMPSTVTWDTEDGLTAIVDNFADHTTIVIQKYANGGWVTYNGEARSEGERFRAYCTRELFGQSRSQVIGSEYVEPAPQQEPEEP